MQKHVVPFIWNKNLKFKHLRQFFIMICRSKTMSKNLKFMFQNIDYVLKCSWIKMWNTSAFECESCNL